MEKARSLSFRQLCKFGVMERIAVFAGSFDPFTSAHLSIAKRASSLFDRIFIVVAQNVNKKSLFPVEVRMRFIQKAVAGLRNISVESYSGLTVDFAQKNAAKYLVRGIRSSAEFDAERNLAWNNRRLASEIETVFLQIEPEFADVSSSAVREVLKFGGDISSMVPSTILHDILHETEKL